MYINSVLKRWNSSLWDFLAKHHALWKIGIVLYGIPETAFPVEIKALTRELADSDLHT